MVKALARPPDRLQLMSFLQQIKAGSGPRSSIRTAGPSLRGNTKPGTTAGGWVSGPVLRVHALANFRSELRKFRCLLQLCYINPRSFVNKQEVLLFSAIAHSFHMSIMVLIMCAYIVTSFPSMSTNLHASCVLHVIIIAKTILLYYASPLAGDSMYTMASQFL